MHGAHVHADIPGWLTCVLHATVYEGPAPWPVIQHSIQMCPNSERCRFKFLLEYGPRPAAHVTVTFTVNAKLGSPQGRAGQVREE